MANINLPFWTFITLVWVVLPMFCKKKSFWQRFTYLLACLHTYILCNTYLHSKYFSNPERPFARQKTDSQIFCSSWGGGCKWVVWRETQMSFMPWWSGIISKILAMTTLMITSGSATSMNILLVILIVFSTAKENHGFENRQDRIKSSANSRINSTSSLIRTKRYVPHMNSLLRNFNFFSNEGKYL